MNSYVSRVYCDDFDIVRMDYDLDVWDVIRSKVSAQEIATRVYEASKGKIEIRMFLDKECFKRQLPNVLTGIRIKDKRSL